MALDLNAVLTKSAAGREMISSQSRELPLALKRVLIMIDGKVPAGELAKLLGSREEFEKLARELLDKGLVQLAGAHGASAASRADRPVPATGPARGHDAAAGVSFASTTPPPRTVLDANARQIIEAEMVEIMGPMGQMLCEDAFESGDLMAAMKKLELELSDNDRVRFRNAVLAKLRK